MTLMQHPPTKLDLFDDRAEIELAEHAAVIKALGKRVVGDVIEIGARLTECKRIAGHGNWLPWLDREFGWAERTAQNFIGVYEAQQNFKSANFADFNLPVSALYLITAEKTPPEARDAVLDLAANGEKLTHAQVKEMIAQAKKETAGDYERQIERLTKRYEEQEARLRSDLETLSPDALQEAINEALGPLQSKIKRLEKERDERTAGAPKREDKHGTQTAVILNALRSLASALTISPSEVLAHEQIVADATGRSLAETIAEFGHNARTAHAWLDLLMQQKEMNT